MWARITIIIFSIAVGMYTTHIFNKTNEDMVEISGEEITIVDRLDENALVNRIDGLRITGEINRQPISDKIENLLVTADEKTNELGQIMNLNIQGVLNDGEPVHYESNVLEIRYTENSMRVTDVVSLSLAIAAVLITIFETFLSSIEKIKNRKN